MAPSMASTSPAFATRRCGLAKEVRGQERKRVCSRESSPPKDSNLAKDARGQKRKRVCCRESSTTKDSNDLSDEGFWRMLPEDLLDLIFTQLPFPAQSRFRCVSRRWKGFQISSPPPVCTIMSEARNQNAKFYSDAERKWVSLPSSRHVPSGRTWEFVDSDAGLVCYQCNIDGWFWLWVCNPLKPSLSRLIRPEYERRDPRKLIPKAPKMKLLVDRATGTYKIVASLDRLPCTAVYDSATALLIFHDACNPGMYSEEFFVWGSKLYAYSTRKDLREEDRLLAVFDMKKPMWKRVPVKVPCEAKFPTNRFFLSNNKEVMLVLWSDRNLDDPYFSVWKLLDRRSKFKPASFCKLKNWKKVKIRSKRAVVDLRGLHLASASFDGKHICFAFRDDNITRFNSRGYKCLRYSFASKKWNEMPCRRDWEETCGLFTWEPNLEIDPN